MHRKLYSIAALGLVLIGALVFHAPAAAQAKLTKADIDRWRTQLSNWGRWAKTINSARSISSRLPNARLRRRW